MSKKIRILIILPNLEMEGAERVTITLLPELNKLEKITLERQRILI